MSSTTRERILPASVRGKGKRRRQKASFRRARVVALRHKGWSFAAIGRKLGISPTRCSQLYSQALEATSVLEKENARKTKLSDLAKIESLLETVWRKAMKSKKAADVNAVVRLLERKSRYLGLDAETALNLNLNGENGVLRSLLGMDPVSDSQGYDKPLPPPTVPEASGSLH